MKRRRPLSPFSLSFLDIMFCGFGAVVLLVLILDADTLRVRAATYADLRAQVRALERDLVAAREGLAADREDLAAGALELAGAGREVRRLGAEGRSLEAEVARLGRSAAARRAEVQRLSGELRSLEAERQAREEAARAARGRRVHRFAGEGDRQYLTGLKVGGRRVLILVDASASMLDETIVNVIRRRNMDPARRRQAPKWRRALASAEWLLSNLPVQSSYQIYTFNTRARPVLAESAGRWLPATDGEGVTRAVEALRGTVPEDGTSLFRAFAAAAALKPRPDNILLITDGLPTQGRARPKGTTVSPRERLAYFERAVKVLPARVPVNTVLLPMEGDAYAAAAYWQLAVDTRGSFLTPSRDWP